ncbi:MAG: glycosyl hydrolase family 65 protein [Actinomycetota bacterium]
MILGQNMADMEPGDTAYEDGGDKTFSAVIVSNLENGANREEMAMLLRSLAQRSITVVVFDPVLAEILTVKVKPSGDERYLLVTEDGESVIELTPVGRERIWSPDQSGHADAKEYVARALAEHGIGPGITLILGAGAYPAHPRSLRVTGGDEALGVLRDQIARIDGLRVPAIDPDPSWTMRFSTGTLPIRVRETLCALANGHIGTRGSAEEGPSGSDSLLVASGVYDDQDPPSLLEGPNWVDLPLALQPSHPDLWTLDLRGGVLTRQRTMVSGSLNTVRFVSLYPSNSCAVLRAEIPRMMLVKDRLGDDSLTKSTDEVAHAMASSSRGQIESASTQRLTDREGLCTLERITVFETSPPGDADAGCAEKTARRLAVEGSDRILAEHRSAWARRWKNATVSISGDPDAELAIRFALFHLMSSATTEGEAAVGARGLTGRAYRGHVFWDTDVYVLPVLAAVLPEAARSILEYRISRLPAAREEARRRGLRGARFPWESADDGFEVTPRHFESPEGQIVPIRTGLHEEHIVADVAWAAHHYANWTGDRDFYLEPASDLVLDTARYWASRIRLDSAGRGHLDGVIGPDEYHEMVDDNAFTNVMARANLRWAVDVATRRGDVSQEEMSLWSNRATKLVDGLDEASGIYEQFDGYSQLESLLIEDVAPPPIAADVLLGRAHVAGTQLIKQADVLMLHHLIPNEVARGSLLPNLDHYLPRTAHGSSLSPAIHASLLARAGRVNEALGWFRLAARLDLEDLTGTTAGGIHLATMGGLWQALAFGFLGLRVTPATVEVDPRLPEEWNGIEMSLLALESPLRIRASHQLVEIESGHPLMFGCRTTRTRSAREFVRFARRPDGWKEIS